MRNYRIEALQGAKVMDGPNQNSRAHRQNFHTQDKLVRYGIKAIRIHP
jgi:hypothetical protein